MANEPQSYEEIIIGFEERSELFDEHDVHSELRHFESKSTEERPKEFVSEMMAFSFSENYQDEHTGWGTYYGPMMVMPNKEGQYMEFPSIKLVDVETLTYWSKRAMQSRHPILKARYADLVWDFSRKVTEMAGDPDMARIAIGAYIDGAQKHLYKHDFELAGKLKRALSLALSINDGVLIEKLKETIIATEANIAQKGNLKNLGFSYDLLIEQSCVSLADSEKNEIIASLERWLATVSNASNRELFDPFAAEEAAIRLAKYYRKINNHVKMREALLKYGNAFLETAKTASALVASTWLQKVYATYRQFSLMKEADEIAVQLRKKGAKSKDEMKEMTGEMRIPKEQMDAFIAALIEGELEAALSRIASYFIPDKDKVANQVKDLSKKVVLQFLMTQELQDHKGQPVAKVGPLHEDLNGHIVVQMAQNMSIEAVFLRPAIEKMKSKFNVTAKDITDIIYKSPIFDMEKLPIIESGMKAFFEGNHIVAAHLLIPQLEDALRTIVEIAGGAIYRPGRSGGLLLKTLDEILRDDIVIQILGEKISFYLRVLLTDQRGWNLRNTVCHGISPAGAFNSDMTDRVFHVLILLAHFRIQEK
jgi:hypothetical protein